MTRACFVILPKLVVAINLDEDGDVNIFEELVQFLIAIGVITGIILSHWPKIMKMKYVKYLLFIQGCQMVITNFHRYRSTAKADDD